MKNWKIYSVSTPKRAILDPNVTEDNSRSAVLGFALYTVWHVWHGSGAENDLEYEQMADAFLGGPAPSGAFECTRVQGDLVRYNPATNELGVLSTTKIIHTYYKPKFCKDATPAQILRRKCHKQPTHLDYVKKLCHQTF